jgi:hypothetical protein
MAWIRKYRLRGALPEDFGDALKHICAFTDPSLRGEVGGHHWSPADHAWKEWPCTAT